MFYFPLIKKVWRQKISALEEGVFTLSAFLSSRFPVRKEYGNTLYFQKNMVVTDAPRGDGRLRYMKGGRTFGTNGKAVSFGFWKQSSS
jgi:hypothetical protein